MSPAKYAADGSRAWTRTIASNGPDRAYGVAVGADACAEANLYLTTGVDGVQLSGLTGTDVFRTSFTADGTNRHP